MVNRKPHSNKFEGLFWMMRPPNSITAAIAVVYAMFFANSKNVEIPWQAYLFAASAAFFTTAHAMVHNDIVDIEIDKINASYRPLPSGLLKSSEAKFFAYLLLIFAVASGATIDYFTSKMPFSALWALGNSLLLDSYNKWFKKYGLVGNFIVGFSPYALFLYADLLINNGLTPLVEGVGLFVLCTIWGREVFKGIYDVEGDKEYGVKTIAVKYGEKVAAIMGSIIVFVGVLATIPLILQFQNDPFTAILFLVVDASLIALCLKLILNPQSELAFSVKLKMLRILLVAVVLVTMVEITKRFFSF